MAPGGLPPLVLIRRVHYRWRRPVRRTSGVRCVMSRARSLGGSADVGVC